MGRLIVSLLTILMLTSTVWAIDPPADVQRAAQAGNAEAQVEMGVLYEFGFHLEKNRLPALAWYMLAAAQGNQQAIKRRDLLMSRMSQSDIEQARRMSTGLARVQPGHVAKTEQKASVQITKEALSRLLGNFLAGYQAGDLDQFISLFADNAQTDERRNRNEVRKDYEDFFQTTDLRHMTLEDVNWKPDRGGAQVWGSFRVEVRQKDQDQVKIYAGRLNLRVEKQGSRILITHLYHSQNEV